METNKDNNNTNNSDDIDMFLQDGLQESGEDRLLRQQAVVEALLFVSGEPVTLDKLSEALGLKPGETRMVLNDMAGRLERSQSRGLLLREVNGRFQLCTRPELALYVERLAPPKAKPTLSQAAYETLSIVAYGSRVTRATVEKIRGVNSDSAFVRLLEKNLIRETGRLPTAGRPMTYDVTEEFYRVFGFATKKDLPAL